MEIKDVPQSLYDILEVATDAHQEEIHSAFVKAKGLYSAESPALYSVFTKEEAEEILKMIEDAYSVLGNPIKRKAYDDHYLKKTPGNLSKSSKVRASFEEDAPDFKVKSSNTGKSTGRTVCGHYNVNKEMEEEIGNQKVFDGSFLQKIREYKNIDLDQMGKVTKIGRHNLMAIESNDFHALPAPVFVRGFVSQIARVLLLDEKSVSDSFMKIFKQSRG